MHSEALEATEKYSAAKSTHPRVSLDDMKAKIAGEYYTTLDTCFPGAPIPESFGIFTICALYMQNGFTVIGKSAPASPENFDAEKGQTFAYEDAIKQLWPLEGYALRERLSA
jgi:hypothetical protein